MLDLFFGHFGLSLGFDIFFATKSTKRTNNKIPIQNIKSSNKVINISNQLINVYTSNQNNYMKNRIKQKLRRQHFQF